MSSTLASAYDFFPMHDWAGARTVDEHQPDPESVDSPESTADLYDRSSSSWTRGAPVLLSDYTARPFLLEWCAPADGRDVLDLGCGEGYVARQLKKMGAARLEGIDISAEMIRAAQQREDTEKLGIRFHQGHARDLEAYGDDSFDLVVAVFLFNYLTRDETAATMAAVHRVLKPGGRFVFAVPHPSLAFLREEAAPFYFARGDAGYFSGRDRQFEGRIWRRDGDSVPVRCVHKTLSDYFGGLNEAGFKTLPELEELHVTDEHIDLDPAFFGPLQDEPLHLAFRIHKES